MDCKEFECKMKDTCLYVDRCEVCKIAPCTICLLTISCNYYKEMKQKERKRKCESSL